MAKTCTKGIFLQCRFVLCFLCFNSITKHNVYFWIPFIKPMQCCHQLSIFASKFPSFLFYIFYQATQIISRCLKAYRLLQHIAVSTHYLSYANQQFFVRKRVERVAVGQLSLQWSEHNYKVYDQISLYSKFRSAMASSNYSTYFQIEQYQKI